MTKDKQVYTTQLQVVADPRSTHTAEERKQQFDLALKLRDQLGEMSFAVDKINQMRLALDERASKLAPDDPLRKRLRDASLQVDELRKKIVATKEGGAITGEERLREYLTELYTNVVFYEGRPPQTQAERADALARELDEELGIKAVIGRRVAQVRHKYRNGGSIDLQFFVVREFDGALENRIFNDVRWAPLADLPEYDFLAADLGLIRDLSESRPDNVGSCPAGPRSSAAKAIAL